MIKLYPKNSCKNQVCVSIRNDQTTQQKEEKSISGSSESKCMITIDQQLFNKVHLIKQVPIQKIQFCCLPINKRIMFDQDIFESECSFTKAGLQERNMSSQHQSIFDCLLSSPKLIPSTTHQKEVVQAQSDVCFTQIDFFSTNVTTLDSQLSNYEQLAAESQQEQKTVCQKQDSRASCNNIASYIIKHCFKQMISSTYRAEVESICLQENTSYSQFVASWKQHSKQIQKHFGVNNLSKMLKKNQSPQIQVVRYFLIIYLRYHYPLYVMGNNKGRKELYIEISVKLLYLIDVSKDKCQRMVLQAQTGPTNR